MKKKTNTKNKRQPVEDSRGWIPVRRGPFYCSPRCGHNCTHQEFTLATKRAAELCEAMKTPGWKPHVWENGGWHYSIERPFIRLYAHHYGSEPARYSLLINDNPEPGSGCMQWHDNGEDDDTDPNRAFEKSMGRVADYFVRVDSLRQSLTHFGFLKLGTPYAERCK